MTDAQLDALWAEACQRDQPTRDMVRAFARAAIAAAQPAPKTQDPMLACEIAPRPLAYPLADYHCAGVAGTRLHYTWTDKPHRLLYDLIAAVRFYAAAHPQQPAPAGWRLVPVEPSKEMQWAGCIALDNASVRDLDATLDEMAAAYRAMLYAAPAAPGGAHD